MHKAMLAAMIGLAAFGRTAVVQADSPSRPILPRSQAFFGLHFDLHPGPGDKSLGADVTEEMVAKLLDRVRPDYIQYDCKGHIGYLGYPSKVGPSVPILVKDSLALWRKVTREHGVALYIHFSGLFDIQAIQEHPDWAVIGPDGKTNPNATSVFGPYVEQRMIPQLIEAAKQYDLDGAWVDGECWMAQLDYSPAALEAWKKETGHADAPKKRGEPNWEQWKEFHRRAFERYVAEWVDAVHAAAPKMQLASNWMYTTFMPRPATARVDFVSGDYDPSNSVDRARPEARYLANVGRPWDLLAWGFIHAHAGMGHQLKTATHLEQEAATTLMQGGGFMIYFQPTRSGYVADAIIDTAGQVADFCRARQAFSHRSTSMPQVALIMSTAAIAQRSDAVGVTWGHFNELRGMLHALLECGYSVDVLAEHQIRGRVKGFPLIVVPDFEILPDDLKVEILTHVEGGGRLLLAGEKAARLFASSLGVEFIGNPQETAAELVTPVGIVNANGAWQAVSLKGAEAIAFRHLTRDTRGKGEIAATIHERGKGRVAAIYGPVGLRFLHSHHPCLRRFIGDVTKAVWPDPAFTTDAPPCVDLALRKTQAGSLAMHMMNRANVPLSPDPAIVDYVPPVGPIRVQWRLAAKPSRVEWLPSKEAVVWSWVDGILTAVVPRLEIHGALVAH